MSNMNSNDYLEAIAHFDAALQQDQSLDEAHFGRGLAYYQLGNNMAAEIALSAAIQIRPNNPGVVVAYATRCMARSNLGDRKGALKDYQIVLSLDKRWADAIQSQTCVGTSQVFVLAMMYPSQFAMITELLTRA